MLAGSPRFTEAELIEIEHRFLRMEHAIQAADRDLAAKQSSIEAKIRYADADLSVDGKYESTCRIIAAHERELSHVVELRATVGRSCEVCCADFRALIEAARRA